MDANVADRLHPSPTNCRACGVPVSAVVLDLGEQPVADALLGPGDLEHAEPRLPLWLLVCGQCLLVQVASFNTPLPYTFHGHGDAFSPTAIAHTRAWAEELIVRLNLGPGSRVLDVYSGDGYLLRPFAERGISVLGFDRDAATAAHAPVPTICAEFNLSTASGLVGDGFRADLVLVNHALAHTDNLGDFVAGLDQVLAPGGAVALEFHHVLGLVCEAQFDIVTHAHRSFLSLLALEPLLNRHGFTLIDAESVPIHGGSVRGLAQRTDARGEDAGRLHELRQRESDAGLDRLETYFEVGAQANTARRNLVQFLQQARASGRSVVAYGAPSRGTTLLNYSDITPELLPFTVDRAPLKQGRFLPGCRIPVRAPHAILESQPDYVLILAWTFLAEIVEQMADVRSWGGRFVVALPELRLIE